MCSNLCLESMLNQISSIGVSRSDSIIKFMIFLIYFRNKKPEGNWCNEYVGNYTEYVTVKTGEFTTSMTRCHPTQAGCIPQFR